MSDPNLGPLHRSTQDIKRLGRLVDIRHRASLDEIATVIEGDSALTGPLMQRAYPQAPIRQTATLQMATTRVGINYILVLLITDLLTQYVLEVFQSAAAIPLVKDDPALMLREGRSHLVATVRFKGKAGGTVFFVFSSNLTLHVADRLLAPGEEMTLENMHASVAELIGLVAKNLEQGLNAGRLPCQIEAPQVSLMDHFPDERAPGGTNEEFYFRHGTSGLRVHLCISPFSLGA
jgi:CheY-specific phosphatase CheX